MKILGSLKIAGVFLAIIPSISSLKPGKLPSGKDRVYKYNRQNPEKDLKKITPMVASFVSRHWLNNILQPAQICEEDAMIVEKINNLEQYIQEQGHKMQSPPSEHEFCLGQRADKTVS